MHPPSDDEPLGPEDFPGEDPAPKPLPAPAEPAPFGGNLFDDDRSPPDTSALKR